MTLDPAVFRTLSELVATQAATAPERIAVSDTDQRLNHAEVLRLADGLAAHLQLRGLRQGQAVALLADCSVDAVIALLAITRAGGVVVPLPLLAQADARAAMVADSGAVIVLADTAWLGEIRHPTLIDISRAYDGAPRKVDVEPDAPFAIIYSSGTTGTPKGIVHTHAMRWGGIVAGQHFGIGAGAAILIATPLYSNTTWITLLPALALGAHVVLQRRFNTPEFLAVSATNHITHCVLVPTQYERLLADPAFDSASLQSYRLKLCTGSHCPAELKKKVMDRWPGEFVEIYGLTEGGGVSLLSAHDHPDKLHTVGRPLAGHEFRIIDEDGVELPVGARGELVSRSPSAAADYNRAPEATRESRWSDTSGRSYLRTGDIGHFDNDGFLSIVGRRKDMIISGGFNIYPQDIEQILLSHPKVLDVAVVAAPSLLWGETPYAFVTLSDLSAAAPSRESLLAWANAQLGRNQRITALEILADMPRNAMGKILQSELRELAKAPL